MPTFLFADLAGFTAMTEAHGDERAADLAGAFAELTEALAAGAGAELIKRLGDAAMLRTDDAVTGVLLGLDIRDAVVARHGLPAVRVGMHTGPAVQRGRDWFGGTVNLAARVSAFAGGDEVLLTGATKQTAGDVPGVTFGSYGCQSFKGVADPVAVLRASRGGPPTDTEWRIDPVCRMGVDPALAAGRLSHRAREYVFCSLRCASRFAADPDRFAAG